MNHIKVNSSNINTIGYDSETEILEIHFIKGGIYQYYNVPNHVYEALISTSSPGSYLHRYIKGKYRYKKIK